MQFHTLSIVIPVYNEEKTILPLLERVLSAEVPLRKEILLVDDGSSDASASLIRQFIHTHPKEKIILLQKKNGGKGSALKLGFQHAQGDIFLVQDADLEYDPLDYPSLLEPIIRGKTKVVYGSRFKRKGFQYAHFTYLLGNLGISLFLNVFYFTYLTDSYTCYKVFHKDLKELLVSAEGNRFDYEPEITAKLLRKKYSIFEVPIRYYPRSTLEGKKIRYTDGLKAISVLFKWRFKKI